MKVVIAGGTGFLGQALAQTLAADGRDVVVLTRGGVPRGTQSRARFVTWNPSDETGAWIIQWPWRGAPNQKWRLEGVAPNVARIVNVNSNLAVGVAGASGDPGTQVIQWPRNGSPDQNWRFTYLQ